MSAPVPPPSRGLVTLDELRQTGHRLEQRLRAVEELLAAVLLARGAVAAPAPPAPPPAVVVPPAPAMARRSPEALARKRATIAAGYARARLEGQTACERGEALGACPYTQGGGIAFRRAQEWRMGWHAMDGSMRARGLVPPRVQGPG